DIQTNFIQAVKTIVDCPRNRLVQKETYLRADKLKRLTPQLEIQLTEHRKNPAHLYRTEHPIACVDTMENRFLKYCIIFIAEKFSDLKCRIINSYKQLTEKYIINLNQQQEELQRLVHHPFFRTVGEFRGFTQESLILKQATGYSEIYHDWIILSCGYDLKEGANSLELKDIAKLYEIWCFIELKNIIKELLGNEVETNYSKRPEKKFITQLGKGKLSKVIFSKHNIELAKICYNPKSYVGEEQLSTIIPCTTSYTVSQQPDIILQLTRRDIKQGIKLTYLFDAKYRIGDTQDNVDTPPDDAINQMHRYRDAIYYIDQDTKQLKKEVIGGYILFPGNGEDSAVEEMNFYKSIGKVNIGAFPLRPQDNESKELLRGFLKRLIWECPTYQILEQTFTHKETMLTFNQPGSVLLVPIAKSRSYFKDFNERSKVIHYYFGKIKMGGVYEHLNFQKYDYFIPVIEGKIRDVYRIEYASVRHRNDIPGIEPKENVDLSDFRIYMKLTSPSYLTGAKRLIPIRHSRIDYKCFFKEYNSITEVINLITE
ncbi:restriction endonuclease-like protein, partial [Bacteroides fragilis]|nr:restriction endonuclease-like protein [Bacteroides fragilis]